MSQALMPRENDFISRVESIEGINLYILTNYYQHDVGLKINFQIGQVYLFLEESKKIRCYKGEINSFECLNPEIEWNESYFNQIKSNLNKPSVEVKYSFLPVQKDSDNYNFVVSYNLSNKSNVVMLKVRVALFRSENILDYIFGLMRDANQFKIDQIQELKKQIEGIEGERRKIMNEYSAYIDSRKAQQDEMLDQFVLILNEKKQKLNELRFQLQNPDFVAENQQYQQAKMINLDEYSQVQEQQIVVKKEEKKRIQVLSQVSSQFDSSVYELSQGNQPPPVIQVKIQKPSLNIFNKLSNKNNSTNQMEIIVKKEEKPLRDSGHSDPEEESYFNL